MNHERKCSGGCLRSCTFNAVVPNDLQAYREADTACSQTRLRSMMDGTSFTHYDENTSSPGLFFQRQLILRCNPCNDFWRCLGYSAMRNSLMMTETYLRLSRRNHSLCRSQNMSQHPQTTATNMWTILLSTSGKHRFVMNHNGTNGSQRYNDSLVIHRDQKNVDRRHRTLQTTHMKPDGLQSI